MVSHSGFDLHFLMISDVEHIFMCLLAMLGYTFFGNNICSSPLPIFGLNCLLSCRNSLYILDIKYLYLSLCVSS